MDSNGTLSVTGGEVYISGQDGSANSAVDFETEATISGGVLVAAGYSGMVENFSSNSTQGVMLVNLSSIQEGGTEITLRDSGGKVLVSYSPEKRYNSVIVSCSEIVEGGNYTLAAGTEAQTIEMTSLVYGSSGFGAFGGGGKGGFGGDRRQNWGDFGGDKAQDPSGSSGGRGQNSGRGFAEDESAALPSMGESEGMPGGMPGGEWPGGRFEMPGGGMAEMPSGEVPGDMPGFGGFGQGGESGIPGTEIPGTEAADEESTRAGADGTV